MIRSRDPQGLADLPGGEVAASGVAHLAGTHQVVEGADRLLERRGLVKDVSQIDVDIVRVQTGQGTLDLTDDVDPGQSPVVRSIAGGGGHLGGDDDIVPSSLEGLPQDDLGSARAFANVQGAVGIRAIDQVDALSDGVLDGPLRLRLVRLPAESQSQGQPADLDAGLSEVHDIP